MPRRVNEEMYWTLADVAREMGIGVTSLHYRMSVGLFPEPSHSPGRARRRYYTDAEVRELMTKYKEEK